MIILASTEQVRYPNQKRITITKEPIGKSDYYLRVRKDALRQAAQTLQAGSFKLYIYLADNKEGFALNLSQIAVERDFGIKKNQFYKAVEDLIRAGYLYQPDPSVNNWVFRERIDKTDDLETFPNKEEAFPNKEDKEDRFFPKQEGDQGAIFPNQEDDQTFLKREWPNRENMVLKQEEPFTNWEEVFPKPIEKDNKIQEYKDNSMLRKRFSRPLYELS